MGIKMQHRSLFGQFMKYASMNILGMLGLSFYILADTFFVSKGLGTNGLAALNLAIPVYSFIHGSGLMFGMGGATRYSIFKSRGRSGPADLLFTSSVCLGLGLAGVFVLCGLFLSGAAAGLLGAEGDIFAMTHTYVRVILLFAPAFMMNDVLLCFVRNDGAPRLAMLAMLGGSLSNVALDYIFIFPLRMGIFGAVFATGLAPLISMLILSRHLIKRRNSFHLKRKKPDAAMLKGIVSLGFPSLVAELSSGVVIIAFNAILLGLRGNVGVAAYGVIANLSLVAAAVYTGLAQGVQPLVSKCFGLGDGGGVKKMLRYALGAVAVISCVIFGGVFCFAGEVAAVFNSGRDPQLQALAVEGLRLYFTAAAFMGFNILMAVFFTSTERALPAHVISLSRGLLVILPAAFLLSALWGTTGVWLALPVTEAVVAAAGAGLYFAGGKRGPGADR